MESTQFKSSILALRYSFLFVPEMSASFTSDTVQIIYIAFAWILFRLHFILLSLNLNILNTLYHTMVCAASTRVDLNSVQLKLDVLLTT